MISALLESLGVDARLVTGGDQVIHTPIDGSRLGAVRLESAAEVEQKIGRAARAFDAWRKVPARVVANWCGCSVRSCGRARRHSVSWCPGRPARSPRKAWAKCRK